MFNVLFASFRLGKKPTLATANVHSFSHLGRMREETGVPLWVTSAEMFEAHYSVVRRSYHAGTRNVPKQVLENGFLRIKYGGYTSREI